jgi:hypothetical protein
MIMKRILKGNCAKRADEKGENTNKATEDSN